MAGNTIRTVNHCLDDLGIVTVRKKIIQLNELSQIYNNTETSYCGIAAIAAYGARKRNRKEVFSERIELVFEGRQYYAPIGYEEYLTDYYGDFMVNRYEFRVIPISFSGFSACGMREMS
jgi:phosphorylcholine metabolism protein LicD